MSAEAMGEALEFDPAVRESHLLGRVEELAQKAMAGGADEAEAFGVWCETVSVNFEKNDLKLTQVDEGSSLGLRVFREKKLGFSSTNQSGADSLAATAQDALTLAGFSLPDEHNHLPEPRPLDEGSPLVHPDLRSVSVEEVVERGQEFLQRAVSVDDRISIDKASLTVQRASHALHSSRGTVASESDAVYALSIFGMAVDGEDVGGFDYWGDNLRDPAKLDAAMANTVERFAEGVLGNLGAGSAESYTGPVLFAPQAFMNVFVSPLLSASSAIAVQRGRSALADKLGQAVAHPSISVIDDPTDVSLTGAARFDREGQPTRRQALVERGVLQRFLYNAYAASVDGCESTGNAIGGARSVPGLGPHSIRVEGGDGGDLEALMKTLGRGLFIQRFSGTVDPASGDFSGVAKSARWVENGEAQRSLKETLISGNAFELLARVVALSSEPMNLMGSSLAPFAIVDGLSVTAG